MADAAGVTMGDKGDSPLVATLMARLMDMEKRFGDLETKYKALAESKSSDSSEPKGAEAKDVAGSPKTEPEAGKKGNEGEASEVDSKSEPKSRVERLFMRFDEKLGLMIDEPSGSPPEAHKKDGLAFTIRSQKRTSTRFEDIEDNETHSEIEVHNLRLWDLLKSTVEPYPYHIFRSEKPVTLYSPFEHIIFKWDELQKATTASPIDEADKQCRDDLKLLLDEISGGSSGDGKLDKYFKARGIYQDQKTIQFQDLWTIFPPGTLVYHHSTQGGSNEGGHDQMFLVKDNTSPWPLNERRSNAKQTSWMLHAWAYDWKGQSLTFERTCFALYITEFEGHRPVNALPFVPIQYCTPGEFDKVKVALKSRGEKFRQYCQAKKGSQMFKYDGMALVMRRGFSGLVRDDDDSGMGASRLVRHDTDSDTLDDGSRRVTESGKAVKVKGGVMVDHESFQQYGSPGIHNGEFEAVEADACLCADCARNDSLRAMYRVHFDDAKYSKAKTEWCDEQYWLCPPRMLGYVLQSKQWAQLYVDDLKAIGEDAKPTAWHDRLQLRDKDKTKKLLFDLVRCHTSSMNKRDEGDLEVDDIIPGKGKGLIILLYGLPGVGKTTTAETIAEATRKPLFSISVADVGTKARHVEANLAKIFALATSWQAILLIDEADVFLESRGKASTERNALVSVFLRVLEYYHGIMFLTTNQIAQFDAAIPSRIHIAVEYKGLSEEQVEAIFTGFLDPLRKKDLIDDHDEILEWLRDDVFGSKLDGRQIRNIVTTALGLARAEKKKLKKKHLKEVWTNVKSFKEEFRVQFDRYINGQEKMIKYS